MGFEELASGQSWQEIDPFKRGAARAFLENSPLRPSAELLERLLDGAEALEEAKGLFRPITLNMLGLTLQDFDRQVTRQPERLIQTYLEDALAQAGIREIAPKIVAGLISEAGTKQPRGLDDLAAEVQLRRSEVKLCLARLAAKGLVRPLDAARSLWEISHDFVAKQLAILLGRLRPSLWPRVALWAIPPLFGLALGGLLFGVPIYLEQQTLGRALRSELEWNVFANKDSTPPTITLVYKKLIQGEPQVATVAVIVLPMPMGVWPNFPLIKGNFSNKEIISDGREGHFDLSVFSFRLYQMQKQNSPDVESFKLTIIPTLTNGIVLEPVSLILSLL